MRKSAVLALLLSAGLLSSCVKYYKLDIQQGNVLTPETVAQVQPGMSKRQVRLVLGTPLIQDPFHADRWDYVYTFAPGGSKTPEERRVTVYFQNGQVSRVDKMGLPAAEGDADAADLSPQETVVVKGDDESIDKARSGEKKKNVFRRAWDKIWH